MRCKGCNNMLTDSEARKRNNITKEFDDLCKHCRGSIHNDMYYDQSGKLVLVASGNAEDAEYICGAYDGGVGSVVSAIWDKGYIGTE